VTKKEKDNDKMMKEYTKEKMIMMNTEENNIRIKQSFSFDNCLL